MVFDITSKNFVRILQEGSFPDFIRVLRAWSKKIFGSASPDTPPPTTRILDSNKEDPFLVNFGVK